MSKSAGSLPRGRRRPEEIPDVPLGSELNGIEQKCQQLLKVLVDREGGRLGLNGTQVPVNHVEDLAALFDAWARRHTPSGDDYFNGRPGLWHALDALYPLQDPNRWDSLRASVLEELQNENGWVRASPLRGSGWVLPDPS